MLSLLLLLLLALPGASSLPKAKKKVLFVVAHPDDETAIAPVLAQLAREHTVTGIIATDGKGGTHVGGTEGDSLGQLRRTEGNCSFAMLGLQPPVYLGVDRLDTRYGVRPFFDQSAWAKDSIASIIRRLRPDLILSFGPDGDTGHPEHRVISSMVTEVLLREGWVERYPLYYLLWTKNQAAVPGVDPVLYADDRYINIRFRYTAQDEEKAALALRCHRSQFTEAEFAESIEAEKKDTTNTTYFRKFVVAQGTQDGFWK